LRKAGAGVQWLCWVGEWRVQLGGQVSALEGSKLLLLKVTQLLGCTRHVSIPELFFEHQIGLKLRTTHETYLNRRPAEIHSNNGKPATR
jgi:hypothetical protein